MAEERMSQRECVVWEIEGGVAHVRFANPDRANAMTSDWWRTFPRVLDEVAADSSVRVVVLSGEGRHFCSGMDLETFTQMQAGRDEVEGARWRNNFRKNLLQAQAVLTRLEALRVPVIAAAHGACLGASVDLLCACDIRYAAAGTVFAVHETNIALTPDAGTLPRLARLLPEGVARELVFTGRRMTAEEAERWGFVNRVLPDAASALDAALGLAREIAAKSPTALWGSKEMLNYGRDHGVADTLRYIAAWQSGMISFAEIDAAVEAQKAKRSPAFPDVHLTPGLFD
jgi:enoyl-CoA hydratase